MDDPERDRRTGPQWLRSTLAYLEFRAGSSWRRDRWQPERLYYLDGIRAIHSLLIATSPLPFLCELNPDELRAERLCVYGRAELVRRLLLIRADLTDRRLLSRFGRLKLARMIVAAENALPQTSRAIA